MNKLKLDSKQARFLARLGQSGSIFSSSLMELSENSEILVLSADMADPVGLKNFYKKYPDRFYNVGIAEQNLVGVSAGLCDSGNKVIASAQSCFLSMRSFEQIRQYCGYMKIPVIFVGVASGFGLTFFGNTHFALEDISLMKNIPGMTVISPSDSGQAAKVLPAVLDYGKPVYIRCTGVPGIPPIYHDDFEYKIGDPIQLRTGEGVTIFGSGAILYNVLKARDRIEEEFELPINVFDVHTISPFPKQTVKKMASDGLWFSIEEHFISCGLGASLSNQIIELKIKTTPKLIKIGVKNKFMVPGDYNYLIKTSGLDPDNIYKVLKNNLIKEGLI